LTNVLRENHQIVKAAVITLYQNVKNKNINSLHQREFPDTQILGIKLLLEP